MEAYLSTPAAPDDRSEGSSWEISRNVLQDLLPPNAARPIAFHITDLGLSELDFQRIHKRSGDVHFDLEIPNSNMGRANVGEGKVLFVVVQDVPFRFGRIVGRWAPLLQVYLLDSSPNVCPSGVKGGHVESCARDG